MKMKNDVMMQIIKIYNRLRQDSYQMLLKYGITRSQFDVLQILHEHGPLSAKELQQKMVASQSTLPSLLQRLENQELIYKERINPDGRFVNVALTEMAKEIMEKALKDYDKTIENIFENFNKEDLKSLSELLDKVQ